MPAHYALCLMPYALCLMPYALCPHASMPSPRAGPRLSGRRQSVRYVIYGAGAVGGVIGAKLFMRGREVVLIARGEHLRAIQADGLRLQPPPGGGPLPRPAGG